MRFPIYSKLDLNCVSDIAALADNQFVAASQDSILHYQVCGSSVLLKKTSRCPGEIVNIKSFHDNRRVVVHSTDGKGKYFTSFFDGNELESMGVSLLFLTHVSAALDDTFVFLSGVVAPPGFPGWRTTFLINMKTKSISRFPFEIACTQGGRLFFVANDQICLADITSSLHELTPGLATRDARVLASYRSRDITNLLPYKDLVLFCTRQEVNAVTTSGVVEAIHKWDPFVTSPIVECENKLCAIVDLSSGDEPDLKISVYDIESGVEYEPILPSRQSSLRGIDCFQFGDPAQTGLLIAGENGIQLLSLLA